VTMPADGVALRRFFTFLEMNGVTELGAIRTHYVSAYTELLTRSHSAPTAKQHLAAIRRLFDWLIVGQVIDQNPAAPVRGPRHVVKKATTTYAMSRLRQPGFFLQCRPMIVSLARKNARHVDGARQPQPPQVSPLVFRLPASLAQSA
jgi:Phage integrase, N-terminal SAM-like domain